MSDSPLDAVLAMLRSPRFDGRDDGLGKPIVSIDLYPHVAAEAAAEIGRLHAIVEAIETLGDVWITAYDTLDRGTRYGATIHTGETLYGDTLGEALAKAVAARKEAEAG